MSKKKPPIMPIDKIGAASFPIVPDLPDNVYLGIGKVISAHAILENRIQELLFDLMVMADYPAGRVAFEYRSAQVLFGTVRRLLTLWGIKPVGNLNDLEADIKSRADDRDRLAHNIWLKYGDGLRLRLAVGMSETPRGRLDHSFVPPAVTVGDEQYEKIRQEILETAMAVNQI